MRSIFCVYCIICPNVKTPFANVFSDESAIVWCWSRLRNQWSPLSTTTTALCPHIRFSLQSQNLKVSLSMATFWNRINHCTQTSKCSLHTIVTSLAICLTFCIRHSIWNIWHYLIIEWVAPYRSISVVPVMTHWYPWYYWEMCCISAMEGVHCQIGWVIRHFPHRQTCIQCSFN